MLNRLGTTWEPLANHQIGAQYATPIHPKTHYIAQTDQVDANRAFNDSVPTSSW